MNNYKIRVGDKVTVKSEVEAYYSNYAENPVLIFKPGMVGIVGAIDVPYVTKHGTFLCIDYIDSVGQKQRFSSNKSNLRIAK